mmetsp:Transcript_101662/g.286638  ORF Transcript_101662/g.286638 Transcript_101662/m.286638 type:complete len:248 (-) Transcript_101662:981-1724(-)
MAQPVREALGALATTLLLRIRIAEVFVAARDIRGSLWPSAGCKVDCDEPRNACIPVMVRPSCGVAANERASTNPDPAGSKLWRRVCLCISRGASRCTSRRRVGGAPAIISSSLPGFSASPRRWRHSSQAVWLSSSSVRLASHQLKLGSFSGGSPKRPAISRTSASKRLRRGRRQKRVDSPQMVRMLSLLRTFARCTSCDSVSTPRVVALSSRSSSSRSTSEAQRTVASDAAAEQHVEPNPSISVSVA